jgi:hypothetical protein
VVAELPAHVGRARERASESGKGRKWARGGGRAGRRALKGRERRVMAGKRAVVGASMSGRSWAGGWGQLTGGDGGTETERERARARETAPTGLAHGAAREREGERGHAGVGADRRDPPVRCKGRAGARLSGPVWAEIVFPFSREISNAFSIYFL